MKIVLCHERFVARYGVDRVLLVLAREFRALGHHVTLLGMRFDDDPGQRAGADRILRLPSPAGTMAADVEATVWLTEHWEEHFSGDNRPDVMVTAGWPFLSAIPVFEQRGCRVVFQDHGILPLEGMPEIGWRSLSLLENLKHLYLPAASGAVAVSGFIRESQTRGAAGSSVDVIVIPNGVDHGPASDTRPALRDPARADRAPVRIVSVGRFEPGTYKRSERLFALEKLVRSWAPDAWIGAFATSEALREACGKDMETEVHALGHPDDEAMYAVIRSADILVCLSAWEGFNLPLAESQHLGRPCLVFDCGAHREVVADPWLLCGSLEDMAGKARAIGEASAPRHILNGSAFAAWGTARQWSVAAGRYIEYFDTVMRRERSSTIEGNTDRLVAANQARRDLLVMDVTNATRDPANSGCLRVARRLAAEWQVYLPVVFVVWEREAEAFRFPTEAEFSQLSAYHGPQRSKEHPISYHGAPCWLEGWLAAERGVSDHSSATSDVPRASDRWLILPEIRHRPDLWPILEFAARSGLRTASIFHDAIPVARPDLVPDPVYREGHADYMRGLSRVDVNLANSRSSALALRDFWRAESLSGRVTACVLPGSMRGPRPGQQPGRAPAAPRDSAPFILMVSTLEPRKGFRRLIEAFLAVRARAAHPDWRLVLVGSRSWWSNEIAIFVEHAAREHEAISWRENASDDELTRLYAACAFTVYASEIEGFGLPILESIWHGRACLCHAAGSMAELAAGGGCLTADLLEPQAFQRALLRLMNDESLRQELESAGRARSIKQWPDFAAEFRARLALARWTELEPWQTDDGFVVERGKAGRLSFILPTYNRLALLQDCLTSLFDTLPNGIDAEFIVVDDHSSDGTYEWLATALGATRDVRVLRNPTNRGYGASVNRAAAIATGEILVLLNQDLRFRPGWLEPMLDVWRAYPHRFAVGNLQYSAEDGALDHAGLVFTPSGHPEHFRAEASCVRACVVREFPAVTFACALVDRQRFLRLGGLDAKFLNGSEDVDICLRARFQGWPCYVANHSAVEHQISASPGRKLAEAENHRRFFGRWQMLAIVLGRDWEERQAWERLAASGVAPPDARRPGPTRVLVDGTPYAESGVEGWPEEIGRELNALTADPAAPCRMCILLMPRQARELACILERLGLADRAIEHWAWCETSEAADEIESGTRWVSGPLETVARRLEADVLYCPAGVSRFATADIPVVCRARGELRSGTMPFVAFRPDGVVDGDAAVLRDAVARFRTAEMEWRWAGRHAVAQRSPGVRDATSLVSASLDKFQFCVDEPVGWEEPVPLIEMRGWCVHLEGVPLTRAFARTNTGAMIEGVAQRRRPDVALALPSCATAGTSGFSVRVPRGGWTECELWVQSEAPTNIAARLRVWRNRGGDLTQAG